MFLMRGYFGTILHTGDFRCVVYAGLLFVSVSEYFFLISDDIFFSPNSLVPVACHIFLHLVNTHDFSFLTVPPEIHSFSKKSVLVLFAGFEFSRPCFWMQNNHTY